MLKRLSSYAVNAARAGRGRDLRRALMLSLFGYLLLAQASGRAQERFELSDVQAAVLEKVISFVRWPDDVFDPKANGPFIVTVLGRSPLTPRLAHLFALHPVRGHATVVRQIERIDQLGPSHVLFITGRDDDALSTALEQVQHRPILTMSASPGFGARGVAVNLIEEGGRVRFEINQRALKRAQLRAGYQLLSVAQLVEER